MNPIRKYQIIIDEFEKAPNNILNAYSESLVQRLSPLSNRQILRLLEDVASEFSTSIVREKVPHEKRTSFKLVKPVDLFVKSLQEGNDAGYLFSMLQECDVEIFKELENYTNVNENIYKFINPLFEELDELKDRGVLKKLEVAVNNREYRKLSFIDENVYDNVKCLKLLFIDLNWYIATVGEDDIFRLSRVSFIKSVNYATKITSFQPKSVEKQIDFLNNKLQNSLTIYGIKPQKAVIKAKEPVAKYFKEDMKKFLKSQVFIEENSDKSVYFSLTYTQPLEILPFIQKWIPYLEIVEPKELKDEFVKNIELCLY